MRRVPVRFLCLERKSSFFKNTQQPSNRNFKMSNAESDRKPDEGVEDDDEPDEWCADVQISYAHFNADQN